MKPLAMPAVLLILLAPFGLLPADWRPNDDLSSGEFVEEESPYYPLRVGDTWTYSMAGTQMVSKVVKYENFEGQRCARVEATIGGNVAASELIAVRKGGIYRVAFQDKKADPPVLFLKLPLRAGDQWKMNYSVGNEKASGTYKCGGETTVKVGDKQYNAVVISCDDLETSGLKVSFTGYYVRNVGMIKQVLKVQGQEIVVELEKFERGK
jgi:hypothetical protein